MLVKLLEMYSDVWFQLWQIMKERLSCLSLHQEIRYFEYTRYIKERYKFSMLVCKDRRASSFQKEKVLDTNVLPLVLNFDPAFSKIKSLWPVLHGKDEMKEVFRMQSL